MELKILGNVIDSKGIRSMDEDPIRQFPSPTNMNRLHSFLGLANYFRRYILNFSKITFFPTELAKGEFKTKKYKIKWENKRKDSCNELKKLINDAPCFNAFQRKKLTLY